MIVTVIAIGMVKMTVHEIVNVVTVRHGFMSAAGAVIMLCIVSAAVVTVGAISWILSIYFQTVFVDVTFVKRMKVPIMKVIHMIVVLDRRMTTILPVLVRMVRMSCMCGGHRFCSFQSREVPGYVVRNG